MEQSGVEWSGTKQNKTKQSGTKLNRTEQNGVEQNGMRKNGTEQGRVSCCNLKGDLVTCRGVSGPSEPTPLSLSLEAFWGDGRQPPSDLPPPCILVELKARDQATFLLCPEGRGTREAHHDSKKAPWVGLTVGICAGRPRG